MAVKSKAIIGASYDRAPRLELDRLLHGRRQGLMEAQRYPEDFDGIIAGAPAKIKRNRVPGGPQSKRKSSRSRPASSLAPSSHS